MLQALPIALTRCLHRAQQGSGRTAEILTVLSLAANPHVVDAVLRNLLLVLRQHTRLAVVDR
eukprot:2291405-Heterocapsa_arctica.AAC.2